MDFRGYFIFLLCEFFCFGILEKLNKLYLEGNLQSINLYNENYEFASQAVFILPILFGLILLFILSYWYKRLNITISAILILIVGIGIYLVHLRIIDSMKDHAYTFEIHFLCYFIPLVGLWLGVYILHDLVKGWFPKNKA